MEILLTGVEERFGSTLELDADYCWMLDPDEAFDMGTHQAGAIVVGQLTDDVAEMRTLLGEREVLSLWHELGHVVGVRVADRRARFT
jgi:hypothetical protein